MKIVYCCDDNRFAIKQLNYSIQTMKNKCKSKQIQIYVVAYSQSIVPEKCIWIDANKYKHLIPSKPAGYVKSTMCFTKLFIPLMDEFKNDDYVLYLDNDIEITNEKILDIFSEDCAGYDILGIKESKRTSAHAKKFFSFKCLNRMSKYMSSGTKARLKEKLYINTGFLFFNLHNIRKIKPNYQTEILECIACQQDHPKICSMQDEDISNAYFDIKLVPPKYAMRPNHWNPTMTEIYAVHYNQFKRESDYPPKARRAELPNWTWTTGISPNANGIKTSNIDDCCSMPTAGKPVDIVYVVGKPQKCKDNYMLRCSLRSVEKHCKNVGRIIVAGYPPDWLSENVIKVNVPDIENSNVSGKHWNILKCIQEAIKQCKLDRPFLYSSDDHFFLKDVDLATFPRYYATDRCPSHPYLKKVYGDKNKWGPYLEVIACTRELLDKNNLPNRMACCHTDTWMDPKYIDDVVKLAYSMPELTPTYGFEPTCMFNAFFERDNPNAQYKHIEDCDKKVVFIKDFSSKTSKDVPTFTIHERLDQSNDMEKMLLEKYSNVSKYEQDIDVPVSSALTPVNKTKKKIAICWIGIGDYNFMFEEFYSTFNRYFCTECERKFFVFTDQPEIVDGKTNCIAYKITNPCKDRSWIRFRKFKYLMMAENEYLKYDYVCYMNGNLLCQDNIALNELIPNKEKYAAVIHPKPEFLKCGKRLLNPLTTASFVPTFDFKYKQSGWILCETMEFLRMANTIEGWRQLDKAMGHDVYVVKHDEAYYNKYMFYHEKITSHLNANMYLCPITWPISNKAKIVQQQKDILFKQHNMTLADDSQKDSIYTIPPENFAQLDLIDEWQKHN